MEIIFEAKAGYAEQAVSACTYPVCFQCESYCGSTR